MVCLTILECCRVRWLGSPLLASLGRPATASHLPHDSLRGRAVINPFAYALLAPRLPFLPQKVGARFFRVRAVCFIGDTVLSLNFSEILT